MKNCPVLSTTCPAGRVSQSLFCIFCAPQAIPLYIYTKRSAATFLVLSWSLITSHLARVRCFNACSILSPVRVPVGVCRGRNRPAAVLASRAAAGRFHWWGAPMTKHLPDQVIAAGLRSPIVLLQKIAMRLLRERYQRPLRKYRRSP